MKQHEREFFIASIRSGKILIKHPSYKLVVHPPTIDQILIACDIYNEAYESAYIDGMMNEEETEQWMREAELWTREDDRKLNGIKEDIEKLKLEIYNSRKDAYTRERIRHYLRTGEKQLNEYFHKKNQYFQNTCEGYASSEKISWIIKNTTYLDNKLYDFEDVSFSYVLSEYQGSVLSDSVVRDLARNEPWRSLWIIKDNSNIKLFNNSDTGELNHNQKNIIIWSQMYDSIQESMDCPPKEVIEDDDLLDGWFISQHKKREKERAEKDFEEQTKSGKIKNAGEVFIVAKNQEHKDSIESMNSPMIQALKKKRAAEIKAKGSVEQEKLSDQRMQIQMQAANQMRGKMGGR